MSILSGVKAIITRAKYGKQIGRVSQSGLACYGKKNAAGKLYTTVNNKTGEVVRTKQFADMQPNYYSTLTRDAKGDVIATSTVYKSQNGYGPASHNSKAFNIRTSSERYNSLGQTIDRRSADFKAETQYPGAFVHSHVNGHEYGTYVNTQTGAKRTYECVS